MRDDPYSLQYVPNWFVTKGGRRGRGVAMCHDDTYYCDDEDNFFKWYGIYKKLKAQKALIKEEEMPITWHPSR